MPTMLPSHSERAPLDYVAGRRSLVRRLWDAARRRKRLLLATLCLGLALFVAAPVALVYYGKHKWDEALANTPSPARGLVARFDGFVLGGDHLVHGWAVRYKLVRPGGTDGFEAYLFVSPRFLEIDAPIFHS
jgi:hypothetical protein